MRDQTKKRDHSRLLLVEGATEQRFIPELIERGIGEGFSWKTGEEVCVYIHVMDGLDGKLGKLKGTVGAELRATNREALGLLLDADDSVEKRWRQVRARVLADVEQLDAKTIPETPPAQGFIADVDLGAPKGPQRLGVWIMPDNQRSGMLETLARDLIGHTALHDYAEKACKDAKKNHGAAFKKVHEEKAIVHTWLAWQDPPDRQLHQAIQPLMVDPSAPAAQAFITWFRALFRV